MCKKKLERWQSIKVYDNMLCVKSKVYEISFKVNRISMRLIIMKNNHSSQLKAQCWLLLRKFHENRANSYNLLKKCFHTILSLAYLNKGCVCEVASLGHTHRFQKYVTVIRTYKHMYAGHSRKQMLENNKKPASHTMWHQIDLRQQQSSNQHYV